MTPDNEQTLFHAKTLKYLDTLSGVMVSTVKHDFVLVYSIFNYSIIEPMCFIFTWISEEKPRYGEK